MFVHQLAKASGSKRWMASLFSRTMSNVFGRGIYVMFEKKQKSQDFLLERQMHHLFSDSVQRYEPIRLVTARI